MKRVLSLSMLGVAAAVFVVFTAACATGVDKKEFAALQDEVKQAQDRLAAAETRMAAPQTHKLSIRLVEGRAAVDGTISTFWRWEPNVLVVRKGDKVILEIENPSPNIHSFLLEALEVNSQQIQPGGKATVEFTANNSGVFQYRCGVRFDAAQNWCSADHRAQTGALVVLER